MKSARAGTSSATDDYSIDGECHLLSGPYALFLQVLIGITAMSSLVYKRAVLDETPRRSFLVWLMDVSKQGFSSLLIHFWNLYLSIVFSDLSSKSGESADECAFYLINFLLDTVLGIFLVWLLLRVASSFAHSYNIDSLKDQGYYGPTPSISFYIPQLGMFLFIVLSSKFLLALLLLFFEDLMDRLGELICMPFKGHPESELTFVMVVCPCFLNLIQYWIQDNIIMDQGNRSEDLDPASDELKHILADDDYLGHRFKTQQLAAK